MGKNMNAMIFGDSIVTAGDWQRHEKMVLSELKNLREWIKSSVEKNSTQYHTLNNKIAKLELELMIMKKTMSDMEKEDSADKANNYQLWLVLVAIFGNVIWEIVEKLYFK